MFSFLSNAQSQRDLYNNSIKAYEAKNYSEFLQLTKQLDSIRPMHPTFTYNLAIAYALLQQTDNAVLQLKKAIGLLFWVMTAPSCVLEPSQ